MVEVKKNLRTFYGARATFCGDSRGRGQKTGQIRVVKAQVESNYSMTMSTKHCLRHAAWTVNRYVIHSDGYTSFERRWGRNYERAICEFGETLLYLPPQHKKLPKADLRMQKCIWLGKVSETGENYVATETGVQKVRTVRRLQVTRLQLRPRATKQSFRHTLGATTKHLQPVICNTVGHATTSSEKRQATQDIGQQTNVTDDIVAEPATKQQRATPPPRLPSTSTSSLRPLPDSPMATSPAGRQHPPLPAPPRQTLRRLTPEEVMQPTAQKSSKDTTIRSTEQATEQPQPLRQKMNAVTLRNGTPITSHTIDDTSEDQPIYIYIYSPATKVTTKHNYILEGTRAKPNETARRLR